MARKPEKYIEYGTHPTRIPMLNILKSPLIRKMQTLLIHPVTLSVIVTVILLQIFPLNIPKYRMTIQESARQTETTFVMWEEIDNSSFSDRIVMVNYEIGTAGMTIYPHDSSRKVKEWDIPGKFVNRYNNDFYVIGRTSNDKGKEIFVFTQSHDSLFVNRISDLSGNNTDRVQTFISTFGMVNGETDVNIVSPRLEDLDNDGVSELVFGINTGFSITPRAIFVCDLADNTMLRSIETGTSLGNFLVADINGDRMKEIITTGYASRNILDSVVTFHDSSSWVMVFDHQLKLIQPPVEFEGYTGGTSLLVLPDTLSVHRAYLLWGPPWNSRQPEQVYRILKTGEMQLMKEITEYPRDQASGYRFILKMKSDYKIVFPMKNGDIFLFDTMFKDHSVISLHQLVSYLQPMDVDLDGKPEMLVFDQVMKTLTIFREDFTHPASVNAECGDPAKTTISMRKVKGSPPLMFLYSGNLHYMISYKKNPYWYARWGIWAATWLAVFLFTLLIRKTQKIQLEKRFATEKKITELQLKIVRNQMDPHFTMNAINAVVDAINREEKEQARDNLLHFSKMYRSLVLSADKIKRSLREEIDFTENYLALEKFRFGNRFTYDIKIDPDVDLNWEVPKMVIQSPVENAVKHGLLKKEAGGEIVIYARHEDRKLILEITDNGIGRTASAGEKKTSTGKGMEIMEQFFELYHKITGIRVQSTVTDLQDDSGKPIGTKVLVTIPLG